MAAIGDRVGDQSGRIVDEALALEDGHDRRGTPRRRNIAVAATASGGATMAPSANAAASGISGTRRW